MQSQHHVCAAVHDEQLSHAQRGCWLALHDWHKICMCSGRCCADSAQHSLLQRDSCAARIDVAC